MAGYVLQPAQAATHGKSGYATLAAAQPGLHPAAQPPLQPAAQRPVQDAWQPAGQPAEQPAGQPAGQPEPAGEPLEPAVVQLATAQSVHALRAALEVTALQPALKSFLA